MAMVTVRCSDAELRRWKAAAGSEGLSGLVRRLLDREAVTAGVSSGAVDEAVKAATASRPRPDASRSDAAAARVLQGAPTERVKQRARSGATAGGSFTETVSIADCPHLLKQALGDGLFRCRLCKQVVR
jgi:hypothetical protein